MYYFSYVNFSDQNVRQSLHAYPFFGKKLFLNNITIPNCTSKLTQNLLTEHFLNIIVNLIHLQKTKILINSNAIIYILNKI